MPGPPQAVEASRNGDAQGKAKPAVKHHCMMAITAVYGQKLSVFPESCATDKVKVSAQA